DPAENRFERSRLKDAEKLVELVLRGAQRRVFERLEELPEGLRIAHQLVELRQSLLLGLENIGGSIRRDAGFPQEIGGIPVLRGRKKNEEEVVQETADLLTHGRVFLVLEGVEQRSDYRRAEIGGEFAFDLLLQVFDFVVVEEVEGGVEVVDAGDR